MILGKSLILVQLFHVIGITVIDILAVAANFVLVGDTLLLALLKGIQPGCRESLRFIDILRCSRIVVPSAVCFVESFGIGVAIRNKVGNGCRSLKGKVAAVGNGCLILIRGFSCNQYNPERTASTIDGSRSGVFQY